jgi:hypothetical protein
MANLDSIIHELFTEKKCIELHQKADGYPWYYHIFKVENTTNFSSKNCTVVI